MNLLAISGSLRDVSTNTRLLRAMATHAPPSMTISLCGWIGKLPIFNPDLEGSALPAEVKAFAAEVAAADGLVIASPEYAHGVPGGLKNALDWLVSRDEMPAKPVLLVRASMRGDHAHAALLEVLRTMSVRLPPDPGFTFHLLGQSEKAQAAMLAAPAAVGQMKAALQRFADFARAA